MDYTTMEELVRVLRQVWWEVDQVDFNWLPFCGSDEEEAQAIQRMIELTNLAHALDDFGKWHFQEEWGQVKYTL